MLEMTNEKVIERTIAKFVVGSHARGTNIPESDIDEGGVCIPIKEYYFGLINFEQANNWNDDTGNKIDKTVYGIDKCIKLMIENNPNMMDYLFLPERCIIETSIYWNKILEIRDLFLSKKCKHTYSGYAHAQLERILTHKQYLLNPIDKPDRSKFNLPERSIFPDTQVETIAKISSEWIKEEDRNEFFKDINSVVDNEIITVIRKYVEPSLVPLVMGDFKTGQKEFLHIFSSISGRFLKDEYTEQANNELRYLSAYHNWKRYENWKKNRNKNRAELEKKCGYDSKHASIMLMLQRQSVEILQEKGCIVDRTDLDAKELLDIRLGNVSFDYVISESKRLEILANELYSVSMLRNRPDINKINNVKMEVIQEYLRKVG